MTKSSQHKEKPESNNEVSQHDFEEGTSARTRPFSFDEIMLKRKNRGDKAKQVSDGPVEADIAAFAQDKIEKTFHSPERRRHINEDKIEKTFHSPERHRHINEDKTEKTFHSPERRRHINEDKMEKTFHSPERRRHINEDSGSMDLRHSLNDRHKVSSRRKRETSASKDNGKLAQDKDKRSRDPDPKLKSIVTKNVDSNTVREGENERHRHSNSKRDGFLTVDADNGSDKRQARDSVRKERVSERSRGKSEIDRKQLYDKDRRVYRKRKTDGQIGSDTEKDDKKRSARDVVQTDKVTDKGREKSERENRHKRHIEDDKTRGRSIGNRHDSERKEQESKRAYLEESRPKRRRSQSREREKERGRRSLSHSPKAHKHTSKDKREHEEPSSHSRRDKLGREDFEVDKKRISGNGSNNHYRQNTGSSSGLGGYSPRKRKTDAAARTPSPTRRSPDGRTAAWNLQSAEKESIMAGSTLPNLHTTGQSFLLNIKEFPSGTIPVTPVVKPIGISHHTLPTQIHTIEPIQLTQATRPMRRLYAENLPASASEKDMIECVNKLLMSFGVNYTQGTQPCISCMIHKEKGQALLEFLTPEYASAALSFDGISFSGSNLKFRRPKDYVNIPTGLPEKSVASVDSTSDVVEDSPHKIFIGGISKLISSEMLLEITRAFGPVKAYHYEIIADANEPCAFLEYVDHSVTSKACAGLNGMRLGGQVVTAVFATPNSVLENVGKLPFYGIPEHAKPLLEKPTPVLKLKNVLDPEGLLSLSESELEEMLEDIRLECSRFGTVKSVNIVKPENPSGTIQEVKNTNAFTDLEFDNRDHITDQLGESINEFGEPDRLEPPATLNELENDNSQRVQDDNNGYDNSVENLKNDELRKQPLDDENISVKDPSSPEKTGDFTEELANQQNASVDELESSDNIVDSISVEDENKPLNEEELNLDENNAKTVELGTEERKEESDEGDKKDISIDVGDVFEVGSIFVEYRRAEGACMAAHCLHGRLFDGRVVTVGYVDHELYCTRFK